MTKQLEQFRKRSDDWLKDMIKERLSEYQKALALLEIEQQTIKNEKAEKGPPKKKALQDKKTTARNKAVKAIDDKETDLVAATAEMNRAKQVFQVEEDAINEN